MGIMGGGVGDTDPQLWNEQVKGIKGRALGIWSVVL